ncbi:glutathione S-transferase 1-like [Phthorimaea operculella]|nr:glutathione S-transferase 1-like [Phthorimaea operculella]
MSNIILYSSAISPPCRAVLMVVESLGLDVIIKPVNMMAGDHLKPEFIEKNPLHTIPLLEEGDFLLPESHAIVTYLVSKYGADQKELYPSDLKVRAIVDQRLFFDATSLFVHSRPIIMHKVQGTEVPADAIKRVEEAYGVLEKYLEKTAFVATDHVTVADMACIATVSTLHLLVPIDGKFVKVHEWWDKLKQFEWYQKGNVEGLAMIEGFLKNPVIPTQGKQTAA